MSTATRATLEAQIADDLTRSDLTNQITAAVDTAIRFYEKERFRFNTVLKTSVTLSASVNYIALSALPYRYLEFDKVRVLNDALNYFDLTMRDYDWITARQDVIIWGQPQEYAVYAEKLMFDSGDSTNKTIVIDGLVSLGNAASNTFSMGDSTAWFNDARNLIRSYAKYDLYTHVIKDFEQAAAMRSEAMSAYDMLKGKHNVLVSTGSIRPTQF